MSGEGNGEASELEVKAGDKGIRLKTKHMAEFISVLMLAVTGVGLYMFWQHVEQTNLGMAQAAATQKEAFRELADTNKQMVQAQREMNCLIAIPQEKRELEYMSPYSFCRTVTR